ncbi:structure-specific endonuclease subunit slx1 isoform X1 [Diospyros lotus]|uniref:structure-specific endonuclease subunit slx1 isoform X1 n=1 Tax=Diospyros lotus TaxID=55363 RepID=UPI002258CA31|nr:structure-specific endonuclease subunit slx1 isoform X1 [Diospyros lotus]
MGRRPLSTTFRSVKPNSISPKQSTSSAPTPSSSSSSSRNSWCAYLILSTNPPIKTYVGVTTNLSRRLKQHNGKLRGGAKASRAGRPWVYACIIQGFKDQSEVCGAHWVERSSSAFLFLWHDTTLSTAACEFESRWKNISRKLPRKHEPGQSQKLVLLQHREAALSRLKGAIGCTHLNIDWKLNPSSSSSISFHL